MFSLLVKIFASVKTQEIFYALTIQNAQETMVSEKKKYLY